LVLGVGVVFVVVEGEDEVVEFLGGVLDGDRVGTGREREIGW
jgi:hypothetical protein